jgi:hypothetical protein
MRATWAVIRDAWDLIRTVKSPFDVTKVFIVAEKDRVRSAKALLSVIKGLIGVTKTLIRIANHLFQAEILPVCSVKLLKRPNFIPFTLEVLHI